MYLTQNRMLMFDFSFSFLEMATKKWLYKQVKIASK